MGSGIWKCVLKHSDLVSSVSHWPSQQETKDDLRRGLAYQYQGYFCSIFGEEAVIIADKLILND